MNITDAKGLMLAVHEADDTMLMVGLHGIGKSEVVSSFAKDHNFHMETLFLSHQEVGDLIGMPRTIELEGEVLTAWTKPVWLQRLEKASEAGKHCVLFLDELSRAPIDVRQTALQLVLDRQIHEHRLPTHSNGRKTLIVAADNPADGDYQVDELDPALLDRFLVVDVEADVTSWLNWSKENNVNPVVRDFIIDNPTKLHFQSEDGKSGATPRSWSKLGTYIDNIKNIPAEYQFNAIKGKIGSELGGLFYTFMKNYQDVIKVEDVEKLVAKMMKSTKSIEKLGDGVAELLKKAESIQKTELTHQMVDKYFKDEKSDYMPMMAVLYSLEIEVLNGFLKGYKASNNEEYLKLSVIDKDLNNKKLFLKIVSQIA